MQRRVPADGTDGSNPDVLSIQQHLAAHPDEHPNPELCTRGNNEAQAISLDSASNSGAEGDSSETTEAREG